MFDFVRQEDKDIVVSCYIQAGASKSKFCGLFNNLLKIAIMCPPVDGKANSEIIRFLSKTLKVSKSSVSIVKGEKQKIKNIRISNYLKEDFIKILEELEISD